MARVQREEPDLSDDGARVESERSVLEGEPLALAEDPNNDLPVIILLLLFGLRSGPAGGRAASAHARQTWGLGRELHLLGDR